MASETIQDSGNTITIQNAATPPAEVVKSYIPQGDLTLYRLVAAASFTCNLCNKQKRSKLIATRHDQWNDLRCLAVMVRSSQLNGKLRVESNAQTHKNV